MLGVQRPTITNAARDLEQAGLIERGRQQVTIVKAHSPGLVVADIQLADGSSGLEAVQEILRSISVPVIFITAYPERLLTGGRPEPTYVLAKPYRHESVRAFVSQAIFFHTGPRS